MFAIVASAAFAVLVTANSAGYRYGVSDQAYYIPAITAEVTPGLFPDDRALLESQGRFSVFDDLLAAVVRATGVRLQALFAAGYVLTAALFAAAVILIARSVWTSWWTTAALLVVLSLRHHVLGTGVNTFEGYFHPRVLAFSVGLLGIAAVLRDRRAVACGLAVLALVVHPTTGAWFGIWVGVALVVNAPGPRWLLAGAMAGGLALVAVAAGAAALAGSLTRMDAAWIDVIASKRYLFPDTWAAGTWIVNAIAPLAAAALYAWRVRLGLVGPAERGVFWGAMALVAAFLASLPFVAARVAMAVQLQTSRVLWQVELLATVYLVWALVDRPLTSGTPGGRAAARALVALLAAASLARGVYILTVQFDRPLARLDLIEDDWQQMAAWAARATPTRARFLVDPQHVGRYGVSFRIAASRDVFLEAVKDTAIATYSRDVAAKVRDRQQAVPSFDALDVDAIAALARRYDLDVMITERELPLPVLHRVGRFRAYALH